VKLPALILLALPVPPAFAQDANPYVTEVSETADGFVCKAKALPELRVSHDWRDGNRSGAWTGQARDTGTVDELHFNVAFTPNHDAPFGTESRVTGFSFSLSTPLARPAAKAHLRIDGIPDATVVAVEGDREFFTVSVQERQRGDLAERLMRAAILELDLTDAGAAPLKRYSWDVRPLRRAPQILQTINWSCR
jgi:hypothetical protein